MALAEFIRPWLGRLACLAIALGALTAHAQIGAGKVVHIIVPFAAGGVQDILARAITNELGQALGSSVIVENRPGAGGTIGTSLVAKAAADGTTLVLSAASHTINGSLYAKLPYDPIKDFTGMAHIGNASYVLIINGEVPAKNVAEFIRHAKSNPGKMNYATAGNGSATHLSMAYFNGLAGNAFDSWFGLLGPAGTPKPVVDQVNAAMARLLKDPVILDRLAKQGIEPQAMTSDEFNRLLRADFERMSKVVKASGARVD